MRAEQISEVVAFHGEGPVWSERWGGLRWVDMLAGDVLSLAGDGRVERVVEKLGKLEVELAAVAGPQQH
jgi:sugar lactone lactonase YvrE